MPDATTDVFDITIIGAGPTGLFGAFYAGLRELKVKIIDALPQMGGQLIALYPEKQIFDTPGFFAIRSKELVDNLAHQATQWKPAVALGERAMRLERVPLPGGAADETCWRVGTDKAERGIGPAAAKKLLAGWSKLQFRLDGKPREVDTKGWGFAQANITWVDGKKQKRMRALIIGMPDNTGWRVQAVHYTSY